MYSVMELKYFSALVKLLEVLSSSNAFRMIVLSLKLKVTNNT